MLADKKGRSSVSGRPWIDLIDFFPFRIFEKYFDDINQQLRIPQTDTDYADRVENLDEKIAIFKTFGNASYVTFNNLSYWVLPTATAYGDGATFYRLGTVLYNNETEVQRLDRKDFYQVDKSLLTKPSTTFPVYLYENEKLFIKPTTITTAGDIQIDIRRFSDIVRQGLFYLMFIYLLY